LTLTMSISSSSSDSEQDPFLKEEDSASPSSTSGKVEGKPSGSQRRSVKLSLIIGSLCTLLNLLIFHSARDDRARTFRDVARLRRPNQFIGLDELQSETISPRSIHPQLLSIINKSEPSRAYGDDPAKLSLWHGFWPPEERTFQVTSEVSTIAEFMTVDYKMEDCQLQIITPTVRSDSSSLTLCPSSNTIDIYSIKVSEPLEAKSLTWSSRPSRLAKIGTVDVMMGTKFTYSFLCPLQSLWAFEFVAADDSTNVRWGQNYTNSNPRIEILQQITP